LASATKPIAPGSPWQNAYAEKLIGTIRRECLNHVIVFGEAHLRRILGKYAAYYESRIHRSLNKDDPFYRAIERGRCHIKRRIKTQTVLPSADTAAMLFWALLVSGQINIRKVGGWQTLATKPVDQPIDLAA
jgi:hypothetical protein